MIPHFLLLIDLLAFLFHFSIKWFSVETALNPTHTKHAPAGPTKRKFIPISAHVSGPQRVRDVHVPFVYPSQYSRRTRGSTGTSTENRDASQTGRLYKRASCSSGMRGNFSKAANCWLYFVTQWFYVAIHCITPFFKYFDIFNKQMHVSWTGIQNVHTNELLKMLFMLLYVYTYTLLNIANLKQPTKPELHVFVRKNVI